MDAEILHRTQFGLNLTFHYIYPPLSIGLSVALIIFEWLYLKTKDKVWEGITKFWIRVFALTFALGVATGVPLVFGFGTNWSRWSAFVGDVLGSALAAEGLFAFTMEAGALGILLFGWNRVKPKVHFAATIAVAFGAHFSGVWITNVNSWMQTPAGYVIQKNAKGIEYAAVTDWWQMAFNPSALSHLSHVILGCWMAGSFLIISVASYYLLKKRYTDFAIRSMKVGLSIAIVSVALQLVSADHLASLIAKYNPVKFAAFEGVFKTEEYTPLYAFGYVDTEKQTVTGLAIPGALSFLVHKDIQTPVAGLDQAPKDEWPWIQVVFQVYHIMVAMWGLMFIGVLFGIWLWRKNAWGLHPRILKYLIISVTFPQIGNMTGWYSTCLGRQPWSVYKLLKTKDAYSPSVTANEALFTLCLYILIYVSLFALFCFLLDHKIKHGPTDLPEESPYRDPYKQD
ncbi:MAG: cytochrome ubiquinol oxidase subunit I [Chlamydiales bacterium]|nr:cytochrome ubiquinol oxidase subunit I [Chlamydiales bacterium]